MRGDETWKVIDVPGAYTPLPTNEAEEVADRMISEGGDGVVVVLDATALERNLYLAFQVLERGFRRSLRSTCRTRLGTRN